MRPEFEDVETKGYEATLAAMDRVIHARNAALQENDRLRALLREVDGYPSNELLDRIAAATALPRGRQVGTISELPRRLRTWSKVNHRVSMSDHLDVVAAASRIEALEQQVQFYENALSQHEQERLDRDCGVCGQAMLLQQAHWYCPDELFNAHIVKARERAAAVALPEETPHATH